VNPGDFNGKEGQGCLPLIEEKGGITVFGGLGGEQGLNQEAEKQKEGGEGNWAPSGIKEGLEWVCVLKKLGVPWTFAREGM